MRATSKSKTTVWRWQESFAEASVDGLLFDETRPPGKTQEPPPHQATHWTARAMAKAMGLGVVIVQRIWRAHGLSRIVGGSSNSQTIPSLPRN